MATRFLKVGFSGDLSDFQDAPTRDLSTARVITNISQAGAGVVTSAAHGLIVGDLVLFAAVVGMTEINGLYGKVTVVGGANSFTVDIATSGFTGYSSAGTATPQTGLLTSKVGILYDDTGPSGDLAAAIKRASEHIVQREG